MRLLPSSSPIFFALLLPAGGCEQHGTDRASGMSETGSVSTCPPPALVEELHAAAFFFEHGPPEKGREHLLRARQLAAQAPLDATARAALDSLGKVDEEIAERPDDAKNQVEQVRVTFTGWPCMPEDMHDHFHASLPPIR